jgi:hypothetical protein
VINLYDGPVPTSSAQFLTAKKSRKKTARIAQTFPLNKFQARQWKVGMCKSVQDDLSYKAISESRNACASAPPLGYEHALLSTDRFDKRPPGFEG